jgi:hypothetical protein
MTGFPLTGVPVFPASSGLGLEVLSVDTYQLGVLALGVVSSGARGQSRRCGSRFKRGAAARADRL